MVCSAFFSGMEIAFVSGNRMLAEMDRSKNGIAQRAIAFFYRHPNTFVSTMLVGNNIALVVYGILFAQLFDATLFAALDDGMRVTADTILSTIVVLFTGEFLPKTVFKSSPNTLLTLFAPVAFICYIILFPISRFATALSRLCLRVMGVRMESEREGREFTKVDLDYLVQSSIDNAKDEEEIDAEVEIFHNALDFTDTKVRDCMVPRTEIVAVDILDCTLGELRQRFIETGLSKILVYEDDIDHIKGYIHSSELFHAATSATLNSQLSTLNFQLRSLPFVPEVMAASKMLQCFLSEKKTIGVVIDEYGGTSGIVALEDIVEEIFGEIEDEHDSAKYISNRVGEGEYMLSGRLEISRVNDQWDLDLPEGDDYVTVGGLILHHYQSFPKLNEVVRIGHFEFKIIKTTATKIEVVHLRLLS